MKLKLTSKIDLLSIFKDHTFLGVDIGTSSIKIVQLTKSKNKYKLDTYGEIRFFEKGSSEDQGGASLKMLDDQVARLLAKILIESGAKSKKAAFSVPVFSSFSTIIEMPDLEKNELKKAIEFQARQYIPAPIEQVSLSSIIISRGKDDESTKKGKLKVLLIAIPNEVKNKYENIASLANLEVSSLEMETFPMARSVIEDTKEPTVIIDIGLSSTNFCVVDNGVVVLSHNYDISGAVLTKAFLDFAKGDREKAEEIKKTTGLNMTPGQISMMGDFTGYLDSIASESSRIINGYYNKTSRRVTKTMLSGGTANMPGLQDYFSNKLEMEVSIADPFAKTTYPEEMKEILKDIGPSFAIAAGLAMKK